MTHILKIKADRCSHCELLELDGVPIFPTAITISLRVNNVAKVVMEMEAVAVEFEGEFIEPAVDWFKAAREASQ